MTTYAVALDGDRHIIGRYTSDIHRLIPEEAVIVSQAVWEASMEMLYPKLAPDGATLDEDPPTYSLTELRAQATTLVANAAQRARAAVDESAAIDPGTIFALIAEAVEWRLRINPSRDQFPFLDAAATAQSLSVNDLINDLDDLLEDWRPRVAAIAVARAAGLRAIAAATTENAITAARDAAISSIESA